MLFIPEHRAWLRRGVLHRDVLRIHLALSHDPQLQRQLLHLRLHVLHLQTGPLQVGQEVHRLLLAQEIVDNVVTDDSWRQQIHGEDLVQPFLFPYQALTPDGKASLYLGMLDHAIVSWLSQCLFNPLLSERKNNIWMLRESNPGVLAPQAHSIHYIMTYRALCSTCAIFYTLEQWL